MSLYLVKQVDDDNKPLEYGIFGQTVRTESAMDAAKLWVHTTWVPSESCRIMVMALAINSKEKSCQYYDINGAGKIRKLSPTQQPRLGVLSEEELARIQRDCEEHTILLKNHVELQNYAFRLHNDLTRLLTAYQQLLKHNK